MTPSTRSVLTFEATHEAFWAEELAREEKVPAEVVPAPAAARAPCDLALETLPEDAERMEVILLDAGIPSERFPSDEEAG